MGILNEQLQESIQNVVDGWYPSGRIDWEDFLDRLESYGHDLGDSMTSPLVLAVQRYARKYQAL